MEKYSNHTTSLEQGIIRLKTASISSYKKKEKRRALIDAFLFLVFLNLVGFTIVLSYLNNNLFMDQLVAGGFIVLALGTIKWISKEN